MTRKNISSGAPWEPVVGYSRAVRIGKQVFVAGTTAIDDAGHVVGKGDAYAQSKQIFQKIEAALKQAGAGLEHVVLTRSFLVNIRDWKEVGRAHGEVFKNIRPCATMVGTTGLVDPEMLVEIEVQAIIPE